MAAEERSKGIIVAGENCQDFHSERINYLPSYYRTFLLSGAVPTD